MLDRKRGRGEWSSTQHLIEPNRSHTTKTWVDGRAHKNMRVLHRVPRQRSKEQPSPTSTTLNAVSRWSDHGHPKPILNRRSLIAGISQDPLVIESNGSEKFMTIVQMRQA